MAVTIRAAQSTTETIAVSGDFAPDGVGTFGIFGGVALNNVGQVAFSSSMMGVPPNNQGIFVGDGTNVLQVARTGQSAPDGNGTATIFSGAAINDFGQVAVHAFFTGTADGTADDTGIFRHDGGTLVEIIREGQPAPVGSGVVTFLSSVDSITNAGEVVFGTVLTGTSGGVNDDSALYRADGSSFVEIVHEGQMDPSGSGTIHEFMGFPRLNESGQVVFRSIIDDGTMGGSGIFRGDGTSLVEIARRGQPIAGGNGTYNSLSDAAINDAGQVAFHANLVGTSGGFADDNAIFRSDGAATVEIVREGQMSPDGNGTFSSLNWYPRSGINDSGEVTFVGSLTGTSAGTSDNLGIFRGDGSSLTTIIRKDAVTPDGAFNYLSFIDVAINNAGQVAFLAYLTISSSMGTSVDGIGIFFVDDDTTEITQVARSGQPFLGSTIVDVSGPAGGGRGAPMFRPVELSESGVPRIAFQFRLADGRNGIALWSLVPEPSTAAIAGTMLLGVGLVVRRRVSSFTTRIIAAIEAVE